MTHSSRLVPPVQLFVRLGGAALAPFAWEVPGMFVGKLQLLKLLGVKDEPRAVDLVSAAASAQELHLDYGITVACHLHNDTTVLDNTFVCICLLTNAVCTVTKKIIFRSCSCMQQVLSATLCNRVCLT